MEPRPAVHHAPSPGRLNRELAIIVDVDGTLCFRGARNPHKYDECLNDRPNIPILRLIEMIGSEIVVLLVSGRPESARERTALWMNAHGVIYRQLFMRRDRDNRKDAIIKEEIYRLQIEPDYTVLFVLDDRNQVVEMWRRLGLACLQVAEGNF